MSLSYYGISFSIPNLSGDRHLNFILGGGIELAAYILAFVLLNSFGRKFPLAAYLLVSGLLCIATVVVKEFVSSEEKWDFICVWELEWKESFIFMHSNFIY